MGDGFSSHLSESSRAVTSGALVGDLQIANVAIRSHSNKKIANPGSVRKRLFDIVMATLALGVLIVPLFVVWLAVRLTSRGPGLYWSRRVGLDGRFFWMPKFRTMTLEAPEVARENLTGATSHITSIGGFLRRWSIDELPQFWCVLTGEMSFIGPRPLLPNDPGQLARYDFPAALHVRPGLGGLSQVRGRNLLTPRRKARLDALYARARTGTLDLEICFRTLQTMVSGRGHI